MLKRLILVRGAEITLFVVLGALPLAVHNAFALLLLTLLAIYGVVLIAVMLAAPRGLQGAVRRVGVPVEELWRSRGAQPRKEGT